MLGGNVFGYFTSQGETKKIIDLARKMGVYAIDTSDTYSEGTSETFIGKHLKHDRKKWFIATKAGMRSNEIPNGLGKKKNILAKVEKSLKRLKTDYIDLYQLHNFDPVTPFEETAEAFQILLQQGKIKAAGLSNFSCEQLALCDPALFSFNQIELNITNYDLMYSTLKKCAALHINIIAYGILSKGLLNEKYLERQIPKTSRAYTSGRIRSHLTPEFLKCLQSTHVLCMRNGLSLTELAIHALLQKVNLSHVIVGVRTPEQLSNIILAYKKTVPPETIQTAIKIWRNF